MKVYLAGPIGGCTDEQCKEWREYAKTKLPDTLDPMDRDFRGIEGDHTDEIVEGDKADIDICDALLVNFPKASVGTCMEMMYAYMKNKLIVVVVPADLTISPWLKYHSATILTSFDDAIQFIEGYGKLYGKYEKR
jgi:nucleoside 2-deoxyribosyltransferase